MTEYQMSQLFMQQFETNAQYVCKRVTVAPLYHDFKPLIAMLSLPVHLQVHRLPQLRAKGS